MKYQPLPELRLPLPPGLMSSRLVSSRIGRSARADSDGGKLYHIGKITYLSFQTLAYYPPRAPCTATATARASYPCHVSPCAVPPVDERTRNLATAATDGDSDSGSRGDGTGARSGPPTTASTTGMWVDAWVDGIWVWVLVWVYGMSFLLRLD